MSGRRVQRFEIETLGLFPSLYCDAACRHCLFSSSPRLSGRLPLELAEAAIRDAAGFDTLRRVTVSGGEPFADVDYLLRLARVAHDCAKRFTVVTNGSFAGDAAAARRKLSALKAAGLDALTISWDGFHQDFLPPGTVRALLALCRALDIPTLLSVVATRKHGLADALQALGDEAFEVPAIQFRCLPVGRAARAVPAGDLLPPAPLDRGRPCRADFKTIAVTHDGSVYPCAAVGGFTPGIRLGNLHQQPLAELLTLRDRTNLFELLANRGPTALLAHASAAELAGAGLSERHDCVACHRLFSSPLGATLEQRAREALHREVERRFDLTGLE